MRAERVAGFRGRAEAAAQPLGPGQVQAEVVVEADADQAPAAADREGDREDEADRDGDRQPGAQRAGRPYGRRDDDKAAARTRSSAPSVAVVPWPTTRASRPVTVMIAPKPTAGSSQDQLVRPASERMARPTSIEAAQISAAEA